MHSNHIHDKPLSNREYCELLIQYDALKINFELPFTFASGIESFVYCDNRKLLGEVVSRKKIVETLVYIAHMLDTPSQIQKHPSHRKELEQFFKGEKTNYAHNIVQDTLIADNCNVVVGIATAGIAWATLCAERLEKKLCYARQKQKEHGTHSQFEGANIHGKTVLIIEDVLSTASSALAIVNACKKQGAKVKAVLSLFTYNFKEKKKRFEDLNCLYISIASFETLASTIVHHNIIQQEQYQQLLRWQKDPTIR